MAKGHRKLDTELDQNLSDEIRAVGGDPDFVRFLLAWNGLIWTEEVPLMPDRFSDAYLKRLKRRIKQRVGDDWKRDWNEIKNESLKPRRKMVLRRTLFVQEPQSPNPPHRGKNIQFWSTAFDLRNYFRRLTGKPHMKLVRQILRGQSEDYVSFNSEWNKRSSSFDPKEGVARQDTFAKFYEFNRARIMEALETGLPLYTNLNNELPIKVIVVDESEGKPAEETTKHQTK